MNGDPSTPRAEDAKPPQRQVRIRRHRSVVASTAAARRPTRTFWTTVVPVAKSCHLLTTPSTGNLVQGEVPPLLAVFALFLLHTTHYLVASSYLEDGAER